MMFAFFKIHITHAASLPTFYKIKISQMHRCLEMRGYIYICHLDCCLHVQIRWEHQIHAGQHHEEAHLRANHLA